MLMLIVANVVILMMSNACDVNYLKCLDYNCVQYLHGGNFCPLFKWGCNFCPLFGWG